MALDSEAVGVGCWRRLVAARGLRFVPVLVGPYRSTSPNPCPRSNPWLDVKADRGRMRKMPLLLPGAIMQAPSSCRVLTRASALRVVSVVMGEKVFVVVEC